MPKDGSGFTPIGDILPSLVRPQHRPISRIEERLIEPVLDSAEILYQHSVLCQTCMPYRDPGGEKLWLRHNGNIRLELQAGRVLGSNLDEVVDVGLPFGPKPRLVFYHLNAEAMRTQSPVVALEDSLTAFVKRTLKLDVGGRTIRSVKDQLNRLAAADFRFYVKYQDHAVTAKGTVIEGVDGQYGYRALTPTSIKREILRCRDSGLAYLAGHNHGNDRHVEFSRIDLESHERGYPALLDIGRGVPVGALVYGQRSVAADIWLPDGSRRTLGSYRVIGHEITRLYAQPRREGESDTEHDRQVRMFGAAGQHILRASKVPVIGLGEVGSLVTEYLARLGVGNLVLIDPDEIESTNLSRVVGATSVDVETGQFKTQIAVRHAREMAIDAMLVPIAGDVARDSVAKVLRDCDFIFLAADSMRARLVVNALAHQYLIPTVPDGRENTARRGRQTRGCYVCGEVYQAWHWMPVVQRPDRSDAARDRGEVRQRTKGTGLRCAGTQPKRDQLERSALYRATMANAGNASTGWPWATCSSFRLWRGDVIRQGLGRSCEDASINTLLASCVRAQGNY